MEEKTKRIWKLERVTPEEDLLTNLWSSLKTEKPENTEKALEKRVKSVSEWTPNTFILPPKRFRTPRSDPVQRSTYTYLFIKPINDPDQRVVSIQRLDQRVHQERNARLIMRM